MSHYSMNPLPTRSYQIDEDDDNPVIKYVPGPPLRPKDLIYASDKFYHFVSPHRTVGYGVDCPITRFPPPQHPDVIPRAIHAFWDFVCNFERLGLCPTWSGWPDVDDMLQKMLETFLAMEEQLGRWPLQFDTAIKIITAKQLANMAGPLRRRTPESFLETLRGGVSPQKEVKVFPMLKSLDILFRETGFRLTPESLMHDGLSRPELRFTEPVSDRLRRHETNIQALNALTNAGRLGRPTKFFPNDRSSVIEYYNRPENQPGRQPSISVNTPYCYNTFIGDAVESSGCDIDQLTEIDLEEMRCHQRHTGRFLLCRVITKPKIGVSIAFAVEDHNGMAITLSLQNYDEMPFTLPRAGIEAKYPVGAILAVKEPYVGLGHTTGIAEIRVAVRTDIERLPSSPHTKWRFPRPDDEQEMSVSEAKEKGATALLAGKYAEAEELFSMALRGPVEELTPSLEIPLRLNRALANLYLHMPGPALCDCITLTSKASDSEEFTLSSAQLHKIAIRKLQAAFELKLWTTSQEALSRCKSLGIAEEKWTTYESKLRIRLAETKGNYDWDLLTRDVASSNKNVFDINKRGAPVSLSDYHGPVEVRNVKGRGRGMFVTREVRAGEVLLVEQSFLHSISPPGVNLCLFDIAKRDPQIRVSTGTAGHALTAFIADHSKLLASNSLHPRPQRESPFVSEMERLKAILNPLGAINTDDLVRKEITNSFGSIESGSSTYAASSFINHSCLPNATYQINKNAKMVWALNDLTAGTELTFSYVDPERFYADRTQSFETVWHFKCDCQLCEDDSKDKDAERERLMKHEWPKVLAKFMAQPEPARNERMEAALKRGQVPLRDDMMRYQARKRPTAGLQAFIDKLEATYAKDRRAPKLALATVYKATQHEFDPGYPQGAEGAIPGYKALLKAQGAVFHTAAQMKQTGRALALIPPHPQEKSTVRALLMLSMMVRVRGKGSDNANAEGDMWSRSAWAAYVAMRGPRSSEEIFRTVFWAELLHQPMAKFE